MPRLSYRRANTILLWLIIVICLYVIAAPFAPMAAFWWRSRDGQLQAQLQQKVASVRPPDHSQPPAKPQPNQLIIPAMLLDEKIHEGPVSQTYAILRHGVWRWPNGSTPDKGGNTTFIGHRFTYTDPRGVFYYLNKVKIGQTIGVIWQNVHYRYRVSNIKVVPPTDTAIQAPTKDARLTIFTCTPLWLPKDRLVVTAKLIPMEVTKS